MNRWRKYRSVVLWVVIVAAAFWALLMLQQRVEAVQARKPVESELLYVPDWRVLHGMALGDDAAAADLLWVRSVFYIAAAGFEEKQEDIHGDIDRQVQAGISRPDTVRFQDMDFREEPLLRGGLYWNIGGDEVRYLHRLLEIVTHLDPRFVTPYVQGALNLALMAGRYEEALDILKRGMAARPDRWEMPYYRGFILLFFQNDKVGAVEDIQDAALKPGAPVIVVQLAAALQVGIGRRDLAIRYLQSIYKMTDDEKLKKKIEDMLQVYGAGMKVGGTVHQPQVGGKLDSLLMGL